MITAIVVVSLLVLLAVPIVVENRDVLAARFAGGRRPDPDEEVALPYLILPLAPSDNDLRVPIAAGRSAAPERQAEWRAPLARPAAARTPYARAAPGAPATRAEAAEPIVDTDDSIVDADDSLVDDGDDVATDATVVFRRTGDDAMQLLPGRLRVLAGEPSRADIRLFGLMGEPVHVTLGRDAGPPHRAVTLRSQTVSRSHARLDFSDGSWTIQNLSRTNPVVVNDAVLADTAAKRTLADGDRIELGEVVLQFMER